MPCVEWNARIHGNTAHSMVHVRDLAGFDTNRNGDLKSQSSAIHVWLDFMPLSRCALEPIG